MSTKTYRYEGRQIMWEGEGLYQRTLTRQHGTHWIPCKDYTSVTYAMRIGEPVLWIEEEDIEESDEFQWYSKGV